MPIFTALLPILNGWLERLFPDPAERQKQLQQLIDAAQAADAAQLAVNQVEAASSSIFVSGWRPWIGWVCGMAFAYHYIAQPVLMFGISCYRGQCIEPIFDMNSLETVLMGMLGLGGLRTLEKVKGV